MNFSVAHLKSHVNRKRLRKLKKILSGVRNVQGLKTVFVYSVA